MTDLPARPAESLYSTTDTTTWGAKRKGRFQDLLFSKHLHMLPPAGCVLEIGAGRGEFADAARARGFEYVGVEPSVQLREALVARGHRILAEPLPSIALPDASVDCVHSMDVIEHLPSYSAVLDFFHEAHRVLRPGGYLSVIAPNYNTLGSLFYLYEYQHTYITNHDRLAALVDDAGFTLVEAAAFLTPLGLTGWHALDRLAAHTMLPFARNLVLISLARAILGRSLLFKVHKTLYDHVRLVARK